MKFFIYIMYRQQLWKQRKNFSHNLEMNKKGVLHIYITFAFYVNTYADYEDRADLEEYVAVSLARDVRQGLTGR